MTRKPMWMPVLVLVAALVAAGCGDDGESSGGGTDRLHTTPTTSTGDPSAIPELTLTPLAELAELTAMAVHPRTGELYVVERAGRVVRVDPDSGEVLGEVVDIRDEVSMDMEQGLLGVEVSPDDVMYLSYTDLDGDTRLHAVALAEDGSARLETRREILTLDQPYANHNGGDVHIGPDGYLYLGLGDGGMAGDPFENGQNPSTLLGTILRIDPTGGDPYSVPEDNPFADGDSGAPEVWLYGVRNPWRFSWDRETGDLWIGDVGQDTWEEIDMLPAPDAGRGANLGWSEMEGLEPYDDGSEPPNHTPPVHVYGRDQGCTVIGGYVYRGEQIPSLDGVYIYGDYCEGRLLGLRVEGGEVTEKLDLGVGAGGADTEPARLVSFGQDLEGELYVLTQGGKLYRLDVAD